MLTKELLQDTAYEARRTNTSVFIIHSSSSRGVEAVAKPYVPFDNEVRNDPNILKVIQPENILKYDYDTWNGHTVSIKTLVDEINRECNHRDLIWKGKSVVKMKSITPHTINRLRNVIESYLHEAGVPITAIDLKENGNQFVLSLSFGSSTASEFSWDINKSIGLEYEVIANDVLSPMIPHLKNLSV